MYQYTCNTGYAAPSSEGCRMAFSPEQAPVYGGGTIVVAFSDDTQFPGEAELFLVYEGERQRHITEARQVNEQTLHSTIPAHDTAEAIQLSVYLDQEGGKLRHLASRRFRYYLDSAHHLTLFLLQSVYTDHALDDLELVRSDYFDLCNEVLSTLDERLSRALYQLTIPDNWNILGMEPDNIEGCESQEPQDNLFHFSARLGLPKVATFFLDQSGSEEALHLPNRHGYLPRDIALENNCPGLAELLSDYNTHRSVSSLDQPSTVCHEGVYHRSELGTATLTTSSDQSHRTVEQDISSLKTVRRRVQSYELYDLNRLHQRQYETDWPRKSRSSSGGSIGEIINVGIPAVQTNDPVIPLDENLNTTESKSGQKEDSFLPFFSESSERETTPVLTNWITEELGEEELSPGPEEESPEFSERLHISDEDVQVDDDDDDDIFVEEDQTHAAPTFQSPSRSPLSPQPPRMVEIPEETVSMPISNSPNTTSILEESLRQLRGIHTGLQRFRSNKLHHTVQELRRENLQRFSSSCPSLDDEGRNSPLSPVHEEDYHKSMLDLIQEGEPSTTLLLNDDYALTNAGEQDATESTTQYEPSSEREGVGTNYESDVRIVINDVTEDSTEDNNAFDGAASDEDYEQEAQLTRLQPMRKSCRRRSWCPDLRMRNVANNQRRDFKTEMLKSNGRRMPIKESLKLRVHRRQISAGVRRPSGRGKYDSLSLSSLENELASEEDDSFHDAKENQTPSQSQTSLVNGRVQAKPMEMQVSHREPALANASTNRNSSPACFKEFESGTPPWETGPRSERALSSSASLETTPADTSGKDFPISVVKQHAQTFIVTSQGSSLDCDQRSSSNVRTNLAVPHSSLMQKSQSTPSLPDATDSLKPKQDVEMRKDSPKRKLRDKKQDRGDVLASHEMLRNVIDQYDAQFRRQEEVEEDEDESLNQFLKNEDHKKSQISLTDFLQEHTYDSDDKGKSKEEKRRRPSVFSKLTRGSNRGRKSKDKENKQKNQTHQFVSVSFSNSTLCNVCGRTLANKPALRCESCMINVHENSCKEQIPPCLKFIQQQKVPQREGQGQLPPGNLPKEKQSIFSQATGLKHVPSFKDQRSRSTTNRQQQQSSVTGLPRSNTSQSGFNGNAYTSSGYVHWRRVATMLGIDKVINEEGENDGPHQDPESNMADTISGSMESLDEGATEVTDLEDEELSLTEHEPEAWSVTVDKKVLKKMHAKDVKRQDTIWELIQTELHYCRSLKILQMIFSRGILSELHMSQETVDRLFPNLGDLIDMHMTFLRNLRQLQARQTNKFIEEIGPVLIEQFSGEMGERMKASYGKFCSQKEKAVQIYKDCMKGDRKFHTFIKRCNMNPLCQRQEIPGFLLLISLRITKYPILIESILKTTKDKKDRETLSRALQMTKEILEDINAQIDEYQRYQRLIEIYGKLDSKATTLYKGNRFKKSDLLLGNRKLLHEGVIGWKNARGKLVDVVAIVLSDLIFFVQESNGKFGFFSQDNKSCVISLYKLLVREKVDMRDSKGGIYLICQNKKEPEMYELVCKQGDKRDTWVNVLRSAAEKCPEEDEGVSSESGEEKKLQEARAAKLRDIIEQMHRKDQEIKACCDEKNRLLIELLELYSKEDPPNKAEEEKVETQEVGDVLQAAIQEASRLTVMLQSGGGMNFTNLSRSVSSVGEHVSYSYTTPPVPKRAETFAGFDSHEKDVPKVGIVKKRYGIQEQDDERSSSPVHYPVHADIYPSELPPMDMPHLLVKDGGRQSRKVSPQVLQNVLPRALEERYEADGKSSDPSSEQGSLGELSIASAASFVPPSRDQATSIAQLAQYLHTIVHLTAQQGTAVESLRAQLAEANERINKLSADMHDRKYASSKHNQLEELRNLQETVSLERAKMQNERASLYEEKMQLEQQKAELVAQKEELQRQKEILQRQVDMFNEQHTSQQSQNSSSNSADSAVKRSTPGSIASLGKVQSASSFYVPSNMSSDQISHKRSASAEYPNIGALENYSGGSQASLFNHSKHMSITSQSGVNGGREGGGHNRPTHRHSVTSFSGTHGRELSANQQKLPVHLLSCTNEHRVGSIKASVPQASSVQQVLPFKLASSSSSGSSSAGVTLPGHSTMPSTSNLARSDNSPATTTSSSSSGSKSGSYNPTSSDNLSLVSRNKSLLRLVEPGSTGRARAASQPNLEKMTTSSVSQAKQQKSQTPTASGEIYF